jgi:hypothetical protein
MAKGTGHIKYELPRLIRLICPVPIMQIWMSWLIVGIEWKVLLIDGTAELACVCTRQTNNNKTKNIHLDV